MEQAFATHLLLLALTDRIAPEVIHPIRLLARLHTRASTSRVRQQVHAQDDLDDQETFESPLALSADGKIAQQTYQPQHKIASALHFATLIQSSCVYSCQDRVQSGDSSACIEIRSPTDCEPMRTARTASGSEAKPNRLATRGDWSTYVCYIVWVSRLVEYEVTTEHLPSVLRGGQQRFRWRGHDIGRLCSAHIRKAVCG